jgi:hypothetical protein
MGLFTFSLVLIRFSDDQIDGKPLKLTKMASLSSHLFPNNLNQAGGQSCRRVAETHKHALVCHADLALSKNEMLDEI